MIRGMLVAPLPVGSAFATLCSPAHAANRPGDGFEVASYSLALTPDIAARTVAGRETITLRATVDGVRRLNFSVNSLDIDSAALEGVPLAHSTRGDALGFDLPRPLRRGRDVKLELSYCKSASKHDPQPLTRMSLISLSTSRSGGVPIGADWDPTSSLNISSS